MSANSDVHGDSYTDTPTPIRTGTHCALFFNLPRQGERDTKKNTREDNQAKRQRMLMGEVCSYGLTRTRKMTNADTPALALVGPSARIKSA